MVEVLRFGSRSGRGLVSRGPEPLRFQRVVLCNFEGARYRMNMQCFGYIGRNMQCFGPRPPPTPVPVPFRSKPSPAPLAPKPDTDFIGRRRKESKWPFASSGGSIASSATPTRGVPQRIAAPARSCAAATTAGVGGSFPPPAPSTPLREPTTPPPASLVPELESQVLPWLSIPAIERATSSTSSVSSSAYSDSRSVPLRLIGPVETPFATVTLEQFEELAVPRLLIKTRMGKIDEEGIAQVLATLDMALARGHPLTIAYDLRTAPIPSRKQIGIALDWIGKNAPLLDVQLQGVAIVLSSPIVRSVVNFVLLLTQPPQPNGCFGDEAAAFAFARSKCSEIRVWVGAGKAKQLQRQASEAPLGTPDSPRRSSWLSFGGSPAPSRASARVPDALEAEAGGADSGRPKPPVLKRASTSW